MCNEQIAEEVDMGANSQEGFAEMNVDGNMKGVWVEVRRTGEALERRSNMTIQACAQTSSGTQLAGQGDERDFISCE